MAGMTVGEIWLKLTGMSPDRPVTVDGEAEVVTIDRIGWTVNLETDQGAIDWDEWVASADVDDIEKERDENAEKLEKLKVAVLIQVKELNEVIGTIDTNHPLYSDLDSICSRLEELAICSRLEELAADE